MRRSASEIINNLERRIAKLERKANSNKLTPKVLEKLIDEYGEPEEQSSTEVVWRYRNIMRDPNSESLRIRDELRRKGISTWGVWADDGYLSIQFKK